LFIMLNKFRPSVLSKKLICKQKNEKRNDNKECIPFIHNNLALKNNHL